jgi:hypothetical protein
MRSTPSSERGRFVLPRDLTAAAATAATLILAVFVLGWFTSGLITGVWSPSEQAAKVTHGAVALATPSEPERAPRTAAPARRTVKESRPAAPRPVARPRAQVAPRRAATQRTRTTITTSPAVPAPVATPVATPAPTPAATATETVTTTTVQTTPQRSEASNVSVQTERSWTPRRRGRSWRPVSTPQPAPTPVPTPSGSDEHEDWGDHGDWDRRDWNDRGRDDDRHHGRGRGWGR